MEAVYDDYVKERIKSQICSYINYELYKCTVPYDLQDELKLILTKRIDFIDKFKILDILNTHKKRCEKFDDYEPDFFVSEKLECIHNLEYILNNPLGKNIKKSK